MSHLENATELYSQPAPLFHDPKSRAIICPELRLACEVILRADAVIVIQYRESFRIRIV